MTKIGKVDGRSTYTELFGANRTVEERLRAKQDLMAYPSRLSFGSKLLFTTSFSHENHKAHPGLGRSLSAADLKPKGYLEVSRNAPADGMKTMYGTEFYPKEIRRHKDRRRGPP
eukprot:TRINITY_DN1294_c0_g1_i2.p1 TRINITY_DN1294_c0_g1~~TRINITY_DN1294_c0_g1_i2.p1  ORF type:complete len:114 (+),score=15.27 TRINITY_DN1294_c0_g1_i2:223-564(+)